MAGEALRVHGQTLPSLAENKRNIVIRQPFGVVGCVAPWNFPASTVMNKITPALAAGNTVVLKPAQDTPLTALALAELGQQAGLPAGVLNVVTALDPVAIGEVLTTHPVIRKIFIHRLHRYWEKAVCPMRQFGEKYRSRVRWGILLSSFLKTRI